MQRGLSLFDWLALGVLALIGWWALKDLYVARFFTSHDGWHQLMRQYHFDTAWADGQIPPRWAGQALNGLGYPLFYFTYQLPFYLGRVWQQILAIDLVQATKLNFALAYLLSGLTMYWFSRQIWSPAGALTSMILYLLAPYRFVDLYVRAALGEHFVFVFLPLVLAGIWQLVRNNHRPAILWLGIGLAGIALSHAIVLQLILPVLAVVALSLWLSSGHRPKFLLSGITGGLLALALSAYYLIPAVILRSSIVQLEHNYWKDHFVTWRQLLYSAWGYGFSFPGTDQDGLSFRLGVAQWLAVLAAGGSLVAWLMIKHYWPSIQFRGNLTDRLKFSWAVLLGWGLSLWLTTQPSAVFWRSYSRWATLDFPFRLLLMAVSLAAVLAPLPLYLLDRIMLPWRRSRLRWLQLASLVYLAGLVFLAVYGNRHHIHVNAYVSDPQQYLYPTDTSNTADEYRPRWADIQRGKSDVSQTGMPPVWLVWGQAEINQLQDSATRLAFQLQASTSVRLVINRYFFPTWRLTVNRQPSRLIDQHGLWLLKLPAGSYSVKLELYQPWWEKFAIIVTIISLMGTSYLVYGQIQHQTQDRSGHAGLQSRQDA